jgi:putative SOS response-associated peptidase YedK
MSFEAMCGRYALTLPPEALREFFKVLGEAVFPPRYNIAPTQPIHVVRIGDDGERRLELMRWGFVPSWVKDPAKFPLLINARIESAAEKPAFRTAVRRRRCLVPATGFYEWQRVGPGPKQPFLLRPAGGSHVRSACRESSASRASAWRGGTRTGLR